MAELILRDVNKVYPGGHQIIRNFNLHIGEKEFVVLAGPEGCGKSTILRMIAGLQDVSSGQILIDGEDVIFLEPRERKISMIFRNSVLYPGLTVEDNLLFSLRLARPGRAAEPGDAERVRETAELFSVTELLSKLPEELTQAETHMVLFARALVRKPEIVLIDSHIGELEEPVRQEIRERLVDVYPKLDVTILYAAQGLEAAEFSGVRMVLINDGAIFQDGRASEIYERPNSLFAADFLSDPALNLFRATVIGENDRVGLQLESGKLFLPDELGRVLSRGQLFGSEILLGLRAADLKVVKAGVGTAQERRTESREAKLSASGDAAGAAADGIFAAVLQDVERRGDRVLWHFTIGETEGTVYADELPETGAGSELILAADTEHALLFDPESGKALR